MANQNQLLSTSFTDFNFAGKDDFLGSDEGGVKYMFDGWSGEVKKSPNRLTYLDEAKPHTGVVELKMKLSPEDCLFLANLQTAQFTGQKPAQLMTLTLNSGSVLSGTMIIAGPPVESDNSDFTLVLKGDINLL